MIIRRTFFRLPSMQKEVILHRKSFKEHRILGWSNEQLFDLVSNVNEYQHFLPACIGSGITKQVSDKELFAYLEIGVPPIIKETYVSHIKLSPPHLLTATSREGRLFHHLDTVWKFDPGVNKRTTNVTFSLDFEFKSKIYAQLIHAVFDQMAKQTMSAFTERAEQLYGPPFPVSQQPQRK
jgi:coenzyme Q-binding protein COQ10